MLGEAKKAELVIFFILDVSGFQRLPNLVNSFILGLFLSASPGGADPTELLIFADFACTKDAIGDPDDCLAVEALRTYDEQKISAIVVSGGNARQNVAMALGKELFPDLPLYSGSRPQSRRVSQAHIDLTRKIRSQKKKLTVLVLSPATDFAILCRNFPNILTKVEKVIFVAGRSLGDEFRMYPTGRKIRDMNFEKDRAAFAYLLPELQRKRVPTLFVGFRAAMNTKVPAAFYPVNFVSRSIKSWARKTRFWFGGELPPFDLIAAMAVTPFEHRLHCDSVNVRVGRDLTLTHAGASIFRFCE